MPPLDSWHPPLISGPKTDPPPVPPPRIIKVPSPEDMSHELSIFWLQQNAENSGWNSPNRGVSCRNGPAPGHLDNRRGSRGGSNWSTPQGTPPHWWPQKLTPPGPPSDYESSIPGIMLELAKCEAGGWRRSPC